MTTLCHVTVPLLFIITSLHVAKLFWFATSICTHCNDYTDQAILQAIKASPIMPWQMYDNDNAMAQSYEHSITYM